MWNCSDPAQHLRHKREEGKDTACNLFMQSDTMLWDRMTKSKPDGLGYVSNKEMDINISFDLYNAVHVDKIRIKPEKLMELKNLFE